VRITVDTNILIRSSLRDDPTQTVAAVQAIQEASLIAVGLASLCEFAWVLQTSYRLPSADIALAIRSLLNIDTVIVNRQAVEAGLQMLDLGGDFADGVVAYEGRWLGGETFVSFDKRAVDRLAAQGLATKLLR
jgi:predicted nucleic-acid-binding protein